MRPFLYQRADSIIEAVQTASSYGCDTPPTMAAAQFLAGGTTILDLMKLDVMRPERLVDINQIERTGTRIERRDDTVYLGAFLTMTAAADHPDIRHNYPIVAQSLDLAASPQIRNMATLGGNVLQRTRCNYFRNPSWGACNKREPGSGCAALAGVNRKHAVLGVSDHCIAAYPGDFAQALIALDASVEIVGPDGARIIPFEQLHCLPGDTPHIETVLAPGELIVAFRLPVATWTRRSLYLKIRDRQSYEFALASAAIALDLAGRRVDEARIALGGVAAKPWRAREAEAALKGRALDEAGARRAATPPLLLHGHMATTATSRSSASEPWFAIERLIINMTAKIGTPTPRVDGRLKVTGEALYASDTPLANPAYAFLATSAIASGRISDIDENDSRAVPGVLDILTHHNMEGAIKPTKLFSDGGYAGSTIMPLASDQIRHDGQIAAVVLAETFEAAREAAHRLKISYVSEQPSAGFDSSGATTVAAKDAASKHEDPAVGDAATALSGAPVTIDQHYATPTQHHNPIELFTTSCAWVDGKLTVWEGCQNVTGIKHGLAEQLEIGPGKIRVISPFIGGAFGSRGSLTQRTALIAIAARRLNRPIKLVATREQGFTIASYRAETRHHVKLGADRDGKLLALIHEGEEVTSRPDSYMVAGTAASTRLYACPNIASKVSIVHADRNTPGFMRSPPEVPYLFALESAMDELAVALDMDPVALRRRNDTNREPIKGLPYTSRSLMPCFDAAATAFGWNRRNPKPGSMREGDWLIGWGCAATMYPTQLSPATARVTLTPQGAVKVQTAAHDIGTDAYTVVALTAADRLGVGLDKVTVELGDSDLPPAPVAGGSNTTASVCNVVAKACEQIRARVAEAAVASRSGAFAGKDTACLVLVDCMLKDPTGASEPLEVAVGRVTNGAIEAYAESIPHGVPAEGLKKLYQGHVVLAGGAELEDRIQFAFGAEFVEVRVHLRTREIRCPRAVGAFAAGRIVDPVTAKSQLMGGLIWGLSSALHEATEIDRRHARYYNTDLAEYLIPVNADIETAEVILVPEDDRQINELGIKGLGELGNIGTNAAVANAVYHATGVRIRELPIRLEKLLDASVPALGLLEPGLNR